MSLNSRFARTYGDLPIPERSNVAVVVEKNGEKVPLSWNILKIEVESNTELGEKGLKILDRLGLLKKDETANR